MFYYLIIIYILGKVLQRIIDKNVNKKRFGDRTYGNIFIVTFITFS